MSGTISDARKNLHPQAEVDDVRELIRAACEKAWNEGYIYADQLHAAISGNSYIDPNANPYRKEN